jgi:hypothetical protein
MPNLTEALHTCWCRVIKPVSHHVTNVVILKVKDDHTVVTRSKGIGVSTNGTTGSVVYDDIVTKRDGN